MFAALIVTNKPGPAHHRIFLGIVLVCIALLVGLFAHTVFFWFLAKLRHRSVKGIPALRIIMQRVRKPALLLVMITALGPVLPFVGVPSEYQPAIIKGAGVLWSLALGWLMVSAVYTFQDLMLLRYDTASEDNLKARRVRTQCSCYAGWASSCCW